MNAARGFGIAFGILLEVVGMVLLVPPAYYLIECWTDTDSPVRHEYLLGFGLSILPATVALGVAALLACLCRKAMSRGSFFWMLVPGMIMALVTTLFLLIPMTIALFQN